MKKLILLLALTTGLLANAQQLKPAAALWKHIEAKNDLFARAFVSGDMVIITGAYTQQAVLMPEHNSMRYYPDAIKDFYKQWLDAVTVKSFKKNIYEVEDLGGYALEIGTFTQNFTLKEGKPYDYTGKYMVLWQTGNNLNNPPLIAAEIWGANAPFDNAALPKIAGTHTPPENNKPALNKKLEAEVKSRNKIIGRLVTERKGGEHARFFLPDAIYMTYYTPMLVGSSNITPYFVEHEKPGTLKIDALAINTGTVIETKKAVIEFGFYRVDWSDGAAKGTVTGKSINVWKRDKTGTLMLYRQMVNHD